MEKKIEEMMIKLSIILACLIILTSMLFLEFVLLLTQKNVQVYECRNKECELVEEY